MLSLDLRILDAVNREIELLDEQLKTLAYHDDRMRLLVTLPGIDYAVAVVLIGALGDISRFRDGDHVAGYLGLVPSTRQSGDHCYHGPITKCGRSQARWMLIQAAQHLARTHGPLGAFFRRLARRKGHAIAVVAAARKMVTIAFLMLKNNEPYRYAMPLPPGASWPACGSPPRANEGMPSHRSERKDDPRIMAAKCTRYAGPDWQRSMPVRDCRR